MRQLDKSVAWILKRRKEALTKKQLWGDLLQKTYRLSQPNRNVFDIRPIGENPGNFDTQGTDINSYVFDLTLAHATDVFVNRMVNAMVPAGKKWLNFVPGTAVRQEKIDEVTKALQKLTDSFFKYIHGSNFQSIIHECFMDMVVSTGFLTTNEGPSPEDPLIFASNPPDAIYADEGPYGTFDAYYRDWVKLPLEHAKVMWPKFKIPDFIKKDKDEVTHITVYETSFRDYTNGGWQYCVIHADTQTICYERKDRTSPFTGFRVKKLSGEVYGRGPAMDAVAAAGTINQAIYDEIVSANFSALPMYMGFNDGVFNPNNFRMIPNTILTVAPTASGTWPIQPMPQAGNIQWAQLVVQELRDQINKILLTDPFGPIDSPDKTATEIIARQRQILENASAQFSRVQKELFDPLVERVIEVLRRKGHWTDIEIDGEVIAVKYVTPLVASEGQQEVMMLQQHIQFIQGLFGPEMAQGFYNMESVSPWAARKLEVNLDMVKSEQELIIQMKKAQEMQQAQQEAQQAQAQGGSQNAQEGQI